VSLIISGCELFKPQPPTPLDIDALVCQGCDTKSSDGIITADFQCTVTAEEKASGVAAVWIVDYQPSPNQNLNMTIALKKVNGKWELADDARLQSCLDEKNKLSN
jgi:hypothetical protein